MAEIKLLKLFVQYRILLPQLELIFPDDKQHCRLANALKDNLKFRILHALLPPVLQLFEGWQARRFPL